MPQSDFKFVPSHTSLPHNTPIMKLASFTLTALVALMPSILAAPVGNTGVEPPSHATKAKTQPDNELLIHPGHSWK